MTTTLTGAAVSSVYKKLVFTKATSGNAGDIFYTQDADGVTDTALTTFTSALTFSAAPICSAGIQLGTSGAASVNVLDSNQNEIIRVDCTGSAVNHFRLTNAATGNSPTLLPAGSDSNIELTFNGKGTGGVTVTPLLTATAGVKLGNNLLKTADGVTAITTTNTTGAVAITGDLTVTGGDIYGPTDNNLAIYSDGVMAFYIDHDADESSQYFSFFNNTTTEIARLSENGDFQIDGDLTVTGNDIISSSATAISLSGANVDLQGTLSVAGNVTLATATDIRFDNSGGFDISDGSTNYIRFASAGMSFDSGKTLTLAGATTVSGVALFTGNTGPTAGTGITGASGETYNSWRERFGNMIKTSIYIDIATLRANGDQKVIGKDGGTANCHLGQITAALNGAVVGGRVTCIEAPAGHSSILDIDICFDDASDGAEAADLTGETDLIVRGGDWAIGDVYAFGTVITANNYLYLRTGTNATDTEYTAGKFLIEIWGTV